MSNLSVPLAGGSGCSVRYKEGKYVRNGKKYIVGLTSAAMVLATLASGAGASAQTAGSPLFSDISGVRQASAITFLASAGVVQGVSSGSFDPGGTITRAEMAKIVVNLVGKGNVAAALQNETPAFTDASSIPTWAWGYVNVAADMGIVNGFPDGSFQPNTPVTDVQVAAMLIRAIGDQNQVIGSWPGNYVSEAFSLGLTNNLTFVADMPASRADAAQMAYNAAVDAPAGYTTTSSTSSGVTTAESTPNAPLWMGAGGSNGFQVYRGVVTGISSQGITLNILTNNSKDQYGPYQGTTITVPFASSYQLASNVPNLSDVVGQTVVAMAANAGTASGQYGQIDYLKLSSSSSITQNTGILASTSTGSLVPALPAGYVEVDVNGTTYPWLVTNNLECASVAALSSPSAAGGKGGTCASALSLLIGNSSSNSTTPGTTVPLATYRSIAGQTLYYINVPSSGVAADPTAQVFGVTSLNGGTDISYTTDANGNLAALYETNKSQTSGVVTSTACASGCTTTTSGVPYITFSRNGLTFEIQVQPYTTMDLNGASTTLSSSLVNDVIHADVVGNENACFSSSGCPNGTATVIPNATNIQLYQNEVTGTITGFTVGTSARGGTPVSKYNVYPVDHSEGYTSLTLSLSNGSSQTYTTDHFFNPEITLASGEQVSLLLGEKGDARKVVTTVSSNIVATPALIKGESQTVTSASSSTQSTAQITVADAAGTSESVPLPANAALPTVFNGSDVSPFVSATSVTGSTYENYQAPTAGTQGPGNPDGAILFVVNNQGQAVDANGITQLTQVTGGTTAPAGLTLDAPGATGALTPASTVTAETYVYYVAAASNGSVVLGVDSVTNNSASGTSATLTNNSSATQPIIASGEAFYNNGGTWTAESLGSLTLGHVVDVYQGTYLGQTFYVVIDTGVAGATATNTPVTVS